MITEKQDKMNTYPWPYMSCLYHIVLTYGFENSIYMVKYSTSIWVCKQIFWLPQSEMQYISSICYDRMFHTHTTTGLPVTSWKDWMTTEKRHWRDRWRQEQTGTGALGVASRNAVLVRGHPQTSYRLQQWKTPSKSTEREGGW